MNLIKQGSWFIIVLLLCSGIVAGSASLRTIGFVPSDFIDANPTKAPTSWQTPSSVTLLNLAETAMLDNKLIESEPLALKALSHNLTNGGATVLLMRIASQLKQSDKEKTLANFSDKLWPAHAYTRAYLADYWLKQNDLEKVLHEWNTLLIHNPATQEKLFPILQQLANDGTGAKLLRPYLRTPPSWWKRFFAYLINKNPSIEPIGALYQARLDAGGTIDPYERRLYVQRLIKEQRWEDAYIAWLSGLNEQQIRLSGFLYDGGFEDGVLNTGFDWTFIKNRNITLITESTIGMKGMKALHLTLSNREPVNFAHLLQYLKLAQGNYLVRFSSRVDNIQNPEGLKWRVRCYPSNKLLGESSAIKEKSQWSNNEFSFSLPDLAPSECGLQLLRLEASSTYKHQQSFRGSLWFDNMSIVKANSSETSKQIPNQPSE